MDPSSAHRQRRLDALPAPRSAQDVAVRLSDAHDAQYPVYRTTTLVSLVLDGGARELRVWEGVAASASAPPRVWNMSSFFSQMKTKS